MQLNAAERVDYGSSFQKRRTRPGEDVGGTVGGEDVGGTVLGEDVGGAANSLPDNTDTH